MIIPSIDLMDGKAVQLRRGREHLLSSLRNPAELAAEFNRYGEVAVIDLDAALGTGDNLDLIRDICAVADTRVGGGIRDLKQAEALLRAGAGKLIIGTKATPEFLSELPRKRVIVALDHSSGRVLDRGWQHRTGETVTERAERVAQYCAGFLCTFVDREGGCGGWQAREVCELQSTLPLPVTVAGGTRDTRDAVRVLRTGADLQVGTPIYIGALDLADVVVESVNFGRMLLVPTIVQEESGRVLMLAYSSPESLKQALQSARGIYYSRSRGEIWEKGATSGNTQELISVRSDCDADALLFRVRQTGPACHTGSYSCFGNHGFSLEYLFDILRSRLKEMPEGSYTARLFCDGKLLRRKILEEAREVVEAENRESLVWEISDLLFFASVLAVSEGIDLKQIVSELGGRHK